MKTEDMNTDLGGSLIYLTSQSSRVTCLLEPGMQAAVTDTGLSDGFSPYIVLGSEASCLSLVQWHGGINIYGMPSSL